MGQTNQTEKKKSIHWADITADKIIRQKGDKDSYTIASGITPSGTVHFGNFREVITVDLVARALRNQGKNVRFIFSWDDYDTFRKVPKNLPRQEELEAHLFQPIVDTPDPYGEHASYAAHHEISFEEQMRKVGIRVTPLYQSQKYRAGEYKDAIAKALAHKKEIVDILNQHRKEPLPENWLPVSIYCSGCNTDNQITDVAYTEKNSLTYTCKNCGHQGEEDLATTSRVKLPWRVDWPMRWAHENVDFEPGGKDHSSEGGSYTTAKEIVKIFSWEAPVYLQYDFVSIRGAGGKMSSSSGNLITVNDVLNVYEPEMLRWIFASYKANVDFSVSFDLDVIKTYEDFDRQERLAYEVESGNAKKVAMAKRVMELAQIEEEVPQKLPLQPSFRHLCNILQIHEGSLEKAREHYAEKIETERDERRFRERSHCALYWLEHYAPEDFKFQLNKRVVDIELTDSQEQFIEKLKGILQNEWETIETDKQLHEKMYEKIHELELKPVDVFPVCYKFLINKEKGPKLAGFIRTIGKEKVLSLLP